MNKQQDLKDQMTSTEFKLYMTGLLSISCLFIISIIFSNLTTPLSLLQLRLMMVTAGLIYFFSIYIYYDRLNKQTYLNSKIIIRINGKEYRR